MVGLSENLFVMANWMARLAAFQMFMVMTAMVTVIAATVYHDQKPALVLNDGDTVMCGGVRLWKCQTQPAFEMVEHHWGAPNRKRADSERDEEPSGPCCSLPKGYIEAKGAVDVKAANPRAFHR